MALRGIRAATSESACKAAGGVWRRAVPGLRKASCALPPRFSAARARANMAGLGRIVRRGTPCGPGERKIIFRSPTNPRVEACVKAR